MTFCWHTSWYRSEKASLGRIVCPSSNPTMKTYCGNTSLRRPRVGRSNQQWFGMEHIESSPTGDLKSMGHRESLLCFNSQNHGAPDGENIQPMSQSSITFSASRSLPFVVLLSTCHFLLLESPGATSTRSQVQDTGHAPKNILSSQNCPLTLQLIFRSVIRIEIKPRLPVPNRRNEVM